MDRRRRTRVEIEGDREVRNLATALGGVVRRSRRRKGLTQAALAAAVGLKQSRLSEIERGEATGTPLIVWVRLGIVLGRPLAVAFSRELTPEEPADAGHLAGQELVLGLARTKGDAASSRWPRSPTIPRSRWTRVSATTRTER